MYYEKLAEKTAEAEKTLSPIYAFFFKDFMGVYYVHTLASYRKVTEIQEIVYCYREKDISDLGSSGSWAELKGLTNVSSNNFLANSTTIKEHGASYRLQICSTVQATYSDFFLAGEYQKEKGFYRNKEINRSLGYLDKLIDVKTKCFEAALSSGIFTEFFHSPIEPKTWEQLIIASSGGTIRLIEPVIKLNHALELF